MQIAKMDGIAVIFFKVDSNGQIYGSSNLVCGVFFN